MKITKVYVTTPYHRLVVLDEKHFAMVPLTLKNGSSIKASRLKLRKHPVFGNIRVGINILPLVCDQDWLEEKGKT